MNKKCKKFTAEKILKFVKEKLQLILRASKLQEKSSALKREHPALQNMKFLDFFFVGHFSPFWILIRIRIPDSESGSTDMTHMTTDHYGSLGHTPEGQVTIYRVKKILKFKLIVNSLLRIQEGKFRSGMKKYRSWITSRIRNTGKKARIEPRSASPSAYVTFLSLSSSSLMLSFCSSVIRSFVAMNRKSLSVDVI
jgi:hypothetical protein